MRITLVMVESIGGETTDGEKPPYEWASPEDQEQFYAEISRVRLIIMGRKTYESIKNIIKPTSDIRRIVMTSKPEDFEKEHINGQLDFSSALPNDLVQGLEQEGYKEALLVGGPELNESFLNEHLVTNIQVTIEPRIFGEGKRFVNGLQKSVQLKLIESRVLNEIGTLFLHYKVGNF